MIFLFIKEGSIHNFTLFFQRDKVFYNKMPVRAHTQRWTQGEEEHTWGVGSLAPHVVCHYLSQVTQQLLRRDYGPPITQRTEIQTWMTLGPCLSLNGAALLGVTGADRVCPRNRERSLLPKETLLEKVKELKREVMPGPCWSESGLSEVPFGGPLVLLPQLINFPHDENRLEIKPPSSEHLDCCQRWKCSHSDHQDKEQDQVDFSPLDFGEGRPFLRRVCVRRAQGTWQTVKLEPTALCLAIEMTISCYLPAFTLSKPQGRTMLQGR